MLFAPGDRVPALQGGRIGPARRRALGAGSRPDGLGGAALGSELRLVSRRERRGRERAGAQLAGVPRRAPPTSRCAGIIRGGIPGTAMPAWWNEYGGPLTDQQIRERRRVHPLVGADGADAVPIGGRRRCAAARAVGIDRRRRMNRRLALVAFARRAAPRGLLERRTAGRDEHGRVHPRLPAGGRHDRRPCRRDTRRPTQPIVGHPRRDRRHPHVHRPGPVVRPGRVRSRSS